MEETSSRLTAAAGESARNNNNSNDRWLRPTTSRRGILLSSGIIYTERENCRPEYVKSLKATNNRHTHTGKKSDQRLWVPLALACCDYTVLALVVLLQQRCQSNEIYNRPNTGKAKASVRDGSLNLFIKKLIFSCRQPPTLQKKKKNKRPSQQHNKPDIGVCVIVHWATSTASCAITEATA